MIKPIPQSLRNIWHYMESYWANVIYGSPSKALHVIGVTGTDGKTTTCTMIYSILKQAGFKVGLITSVSARIGDQELDTGFHVTTPDPEKLVKYLAMMRDKGIEWVVLEVTSHGLEQNRVANIEFEKAVFTNITHDHLDYHKTWKNYARAKARLIRMVKEGGEVIYKKDEQGGKFIEKAINKAPFVLFSKVCSDELAKARSVTKDGVKFIYDIKGKSVPIAIPVLGEYNIANAQCAIKTIEDLVESKDIIEALGNFPGVKGRMEIVQRYTPATIIIDFAHTPNALYKALSNINILKEEGRSIVVFGCAGLRDFSKRKTMGAVAAKLSDIIIITSEDPRTEKLRKINNLILSGGLEQKGNLIKRFGSHEEYISMNIEESEELVLKAKNTGLKSIFVFDEESIASRQDAIDLSIRLAHSEDIVIITGKGHEASMCFGHTEYPWGDHNAVQKSLHIRYPSIQ